MDLDECCNQRAPSPDFKPIMEPLPVGNQFVMISLCFGILTLRIRGEGELKEVFLLSCSVFCNDRRRRQLCVEHAHRRLIKLESGSSEDGLIRSTLFYASKWWKNCALSYEMTHITYFSFSFR